MSRAFRVRFLGVLLVLCLSCTCSKKKPPLLFRAVPAEAVALMQIDIKANESLSTTIVEALPTEMAQDILDEYAAFRRTAAEIGIDLNKTKSLIVMMFGSAAVDNMLIIVEGINADEIKGTNKEVFHGVNIGATSKGILPDAKYYAGLSPLGVVFGAKLELVKKAVASYAGKGKCISDTDAWESIQKLRPIKKSYNHLRMYIWGNMRDETMPVTMKVIGVFSDYDKGFQACIASDEEDAETLKRLAEFGLASRIASPTSDTPPEFVEMDSLLREELKTIKVSVEKDVVSVEYKGNVAQTIKRMVSMIADYIPKLVREDVLIAIHTNLEVCFKAVVDHVDCSDTLFPPTMKNKKCPAGLTIDSLTGAYSISKLYTEEESEERWMALDVVDLEIPDVPPACYQVTSDAPGKPVKDGQKFTCHAWADFDNDGKLAHWYIQGIYKKETSSFEMGEVVQDEKADDW